jgi:hypothetical protein
LRLNQSLPLMIVNRDCRPVMADGVAEMWVRPSNPQSLFVRYAMKIYNFASDTGPGCYLQPSQGALDPGQAFRSSKDRQTFEKAKPDCLSGDGDSERVNDLCVADTFSLDEILQ